MAYTGRTRDTIRDNLLAVWASEYAALDQRLLVAPGSDAFLWASAVAVMMEGLEAQAESVERDILPDEASPTALARHALVDGVPRGVGTRARRTVTLTGPTAGNISIPAGTRMSFSDGTLYNVDSASVILSGGSPTGSVMVTAVEPGSNGNRASGATLTFLSTPSGLNGTGAVTLTSAVDGTDQESLSAWAQRIIRRRQERPASGNRADWRSWVEGYLGTTIERAYVYPLLQPPVSAPGAGTPSTPGCVTVVATGPAQGDNITNTRIIPTDNISARTAGATLPLIRGYIEGDYDAHGVATPLTGTQLRPVTMSPANCTVEAIATTSRDVTLQVTNNEANAFPWTGTVAISSATSTTIVAAGDHTAINGTQVLLNIGVGYHRGATVRATMPVGVFAAGNTTWTFSTPFPSAPYSTIYPCPPNWETLQAAVFRYFDALGPGDTSPPSRWPSESSEARSTLYRTALASEVLNDVVSISAQGALVSTPTGVLAATTTLPVTDVTPAAKTVVTLGTLLVIP